MTVDERTELLRVAREALLKVDSAHEAPWIIEDLEALGLPDAAARRAKLSEILARRSRGEPLAYVLGHWAFRNLEFFVGPGALIPRPETEELVEYALADLLGRPDEVARIRREGLRVVDFGAGSGCIGLGFFHALLQSPEVRGVKAPFELSLVEKSPEAIHWARRNTDAHRARLGPVDVKILEMSWNDFRGTDLDLVLSNPPYLSSEEYLGIEASVRDFEPKSALVPGGSRGESDANRAYEEVLDVAARVLRPGGRVYFELGLVQDPWILEEARRRGHWADARLLRDLQAKNRFFAAHLDPL